MNFQQFLVEFEGIGLKSTECSNRVSPPPRHHLDDNRVCFLFDQFSLIIIITIVVVIVIIIIIIININKTSPISTSLAALRSLLSSTSHVAHKHTSLSSLPPSIAAVFIRLLYSIRHFESTYCSDLQLQLLLAHNLRQRRKFVYYQFGIGLFHLKSSPLLSSSISSPIISSHLIH